MRLRETGGGYLYIKYTSSALELRQNGGGAALDTETTSTPSGVWYEYHAIVGGPDISVWRRVKNSSDPMTLVLSTSSATQLAASYLTFASVPGNFLADISILKVDGDILKSEVYTYNAANELTAQALDGYTVNYAYDQFGRLTSKTKGGSTGTYYYNYGDKLTKVASNFGGEGTVTYTYSGDQKRRSRDGGGAMTKYRVDQGYGVVNEENSGGTLLSTYVHHPGRQIGTVLATSEGSTASSGTWAYYFQDAIGSTRGLWDDDGDRLGKYDYTPFGGKLGESGMEITRKFTGHDWDNEARLYHTAYRQYSPDSGRWLTRDPLGMVDGPNVYAYVVNNPVTMVDPKGGAILHYILAIAVYAFVLVAVLALLTGVVMFIGFKFGVLELAGNGICDPENVFAAFLFLMIHIGLSVFSCSSCVLAIGFALGMAWAPEPVTKLAAILTCLSCLVNVLSVYAYAKAIEEEQEDCKKSQAQSGFPKATASSSCSAA